MEKPFSNTSKAAMEPTITLILQTIYTLLSTLPSPIRCLPRFQKIISTTPQNQTSQPNVPQSQDNLTASIQMKKVALWMKQLEQPFQKYSLFFEAGLFRLFRTRIE